MFILEIHFSLFVFTILDTQAFSNHQMLWNSLNDAGLVKINLKLERIDWQGSVNRAKEQQSTSSESVLPTWLDESLDEPREAARANWKSIR